MGMEIQSTVKRRGEAKAAEPTTGRDTGRPIVRPLAISLKKLIRIPSTAALCVQYGSLIVCNIDHSLARLANAA